MAASESMIQLVKALVPRLLEGDDQLHKVLAAQWTAASFVVQTETNWGFFAKFSVPAYLPSTDPKRLVGCDAVIPVHGVRHNAGCVLYVDNGVLDELEVYTYDEPWEHPPTFGVPSHVRPISVQDAPQVQAPIRGT